MAASGVYSQGRASFVARSVFALRELHIILTVTAGGEPKLFSYKRVVITVNPVKPAE